MSSLDPLIRIAACTLIVVICAIRLRDFRRDRREWLLSALSICTIGFVSGNTPQDFLSPVVTFAVTANIAARLLVPCLWLYVLSLFKAEFRIEPSYVGVAAIWAFLSFANRGWLGAALQVAIPDAALLIAASIIVIHMICTLLLGLEGDLSSGRRASRIVLVLGLISFLVADLAVDTVMGPSWNPLAFTVWQNGAILAGATLFTAVALRARPLWVPAPQPASLCPVTERIVEAMTVRHAYLEPRIRIAHLARDVGVSETVLRRTIYETLGFQHFTEFVNYYRVEHAKRLLRDKAQASEKIVSIALDSGFNSLSSFQRVFRQSTGMSARDWRHLQLSK